MLKIDLIIIKRRTELHGIPVYEGRCRRGKRDDHRKNDHGHLAVSLFPAVFWNLFPTRTHVSST